MAAASNIMIAVRHEGGARKVFGIRTRQSFDAGVRLRSFFLVNDPVCKLCSSWGFSREGNMSCPLNEFTIPDAK